MSTKLLVETVDGITTLRLTRQLPLDEFYEMLDETAGSEIGTKRLWDVTKNFSYSAEEIRQIADRVKRNWPRPECVAFVAADDLTFGLMRMFEAFRAADFRIKVFRDEELAREWLLACNEADD